MGEKFLDGWLTLNGWTWKDKSTTRHVCSGGLASAMLNITLHPSEQGLERTTPLTECSPGRSIVFLSEFLKKRIFLTQIVKLEVYLRLPRCVLRDF